MKEEKKYLPIGSVVLLKGGKKKLMITGYCMKIEEDPNKIYDYNGCLFPEGEIKSNITSVFDHKQIEKVFFIGFENEESETFINDIQNKMKELETKEEIL